MHKLNSFLRNWVLQILILLTLNLPSSFAESGWLRTNRPVGESPFSSILCDRSNPGVLYIGVKGAIIKTSNSGRDWVKLYKIPGLGARVNTLIQSPGKARTIFAATSSGLFKTEDGGLRWTELKLPGQSVEVLDVLVDAKDPLRILAGTAETLLLSEDGGIRWSAANLGGTPSSFYSIVQNNLASDTFYAASEEAVYKTGNGCLNWKKILSLGDNPEEEPGQDEENGSQKTRIKIALTSHNEDIVYVAFGKTLFHSADGGASWRRVSGCGIFDSHIVDMLVSPYEPRYLFLAENDRVRRYSAESGRCLDISRSSPLRGVVSLALDESLKRLWAITEEEVYVSNFDLYGGGPMGDKLSIPEKPAAFAGEPTYREVQEKAILYAEVHPDKIENWRRQARLRALLPDISFGIDHDSSNNLHWDAGANPDTWVLGPEDEDTGWDISCSWRLGDLIWNDDQANIDVRSRLMVQLRDDVLDEVTHLYFERRRLQRELYGDPKRDETDRAEDELLLEELTAGIDALTGGWFSEEIRRRGN